MTIMKEGDKKVTNVVGDEKLVLLPSYFVSANIKAIILKDMR